MKPGRTGSPTSLPTLLPWWLPTSFTPQIAYQPRKPITMMSYMNPAPQNSAHTKEYGLNKPMPFNGDWTKVKAFLQECLVYIDMNEDVYTMDKLKIGFVLSYMNKKEAKDWRELYLEDIENPVTGKLVYPTFSAFLTEVHKAFWSAVIMLTVF